MSAVTDVQATLRSSADPEKALFFPKFFKTRPGYPADDQFLGVKVPVQRAVAKQYYRQLAPEDVMKLLQSKWHEERLTALFLLILQFQKIPERQHHIYELYMANLQHVNNWDLVDSSAGYIVGGWLYGRAEKMQVLKDLAKRPGVWERRVAVLATFHDIMRGEADAALQIISILLHDEDDYIHKAVGWMLREIGKRVDQQLLRDFLNEHAVAMPRTALRYAIEHLPEQERKEYLNRGKSIDKNSKI